MNIIKLNAIPSTNSFLLETLKNQSLPDLTIVVAKTQTNGRGQRQTQWESVTDKSLTFSVFKKFNKLPVTKHPLLLFAVALAVREALEQIMSYTCQIKWPNDIMAGKHKISGILIENQINSNFLNSAVIGIGVNVNNTSFNNIPQATSMQLLTNKTFELEEVMLQIYKNIQHYLDYVTSNKENTLKQLYEKHLYKKDQISVFKTSAGIFFNGIIRGVTKTGKLQVETEDGTLTEFNTKTISLQ